MPYEIAHEDGQFVVRKKGGKALGKHKSKAEAEAQMRALYAAEKRSGSGKALGIDEPAEVLVYPGGSVKAAGDAGEFVGYAWRWGSPELPDRTPTRDHFTPETHFGRYADGPLDVLYHHGLPFVKGVPNPLADVEIGRATVVRDDEGGWLSGTLDLSIPGVADVWAALKADDGAFGLSSGAVSHRVRRVPQPNGSHWLKRWDVVEVSITPEPGEPRTAAVALKSLIEDSDAESFIDSCLKAAADLTASAARFAKIGPAKRDAIKSLRDALDATIRASAPLDPAEILRRRSNVERLLARLG